MKKAKRTHRVRKNKPEYMSDAAFADLQQALEDALAFERTQFCELNVTRIQAPRSPKAI
jgi:hypothetical protein